MKELKPSGMQCRAFRSEFLDLRSSWFSTVSCHVQSLAGILLLDRGWTIKACFLNSSISSFGLAHSSFKQVVSRHHCLDHLCRFFSPGAACLLPIMICFATLRQPPFALKIARLSLRKSACSLSSSWLEFAFFLSSSSCCFRHTLSISPSQSSCSATASLWLRAATLEWCSSRSSVPSSSLSMRAQHPKFLCVISPPHEGHFIQF